MAIRSLSIPYSAYNNKCLPSLRKPQNSTERSKRPVKNMEGALCGNPLPAHIPSPVQAYSFLRLRQLLALIFFWSGRGRPVPKFLAIYFFSQRVILVKNDYKRRPTTKSGDLPCLRGFLRRICCDTTACSSL